jgi:hypothetical protein
LVVLLVLDLGWVGVDGEVVEKVCSFACFGGVDKEICGLDGCG